MKCSLGISNFLEEIFSLSHSVVFLCFFALITEEGVLISPCHSLELCIQMVKFFLFLCLFASLLFSAICKASPDNHFAFLHFFFLGMVLITIFCTMLQTSIHISLGTCLSDLIWYRQSWEAWHAGISPFGEGCHYPYQSLASSQTSRREHSPIHQQKIGLKIYWAWPCPPEQDPVLPTANSSGQI